MNKWISLSLLLISQQALSALNESTIVASVKKHFPLIKAEVSTINEEKANLLSQQGVFDHKIKGLTYAQPQGGYERNYHDVYIDAPVENTPLKLFAGYRIGRGDYPVYYQADYTNRDGEDRMGLSIPLLRDYGIDENRLKIYQSEIEVRKKEINKQLTEIQVIQEARDSYWEWVGRALLLDINKIVLDNAIERQNAIEKQVTLGDTEEIKITENKQQIYNRQNAYQQAEKAYQQVINKLSLYYRDDKGRPKFAQKKELPHVNKHLRDKQLRPEYLNYLYQNHPELEHIRLYQSQLRLAMKMAKNELLPKLDLKFYTEEDHGGDNPSLSVRSYNVSLNYELPLRQRKAKGKIAAIFNKISMTNHKAHYIKNALTVSIRDLLLLLAAETKGYQLESQEVDAARKVLHAEAEKFASGGSSLFVVNQREQILAREQKKATQLLIDYYKTINKLEALCFYEKSCIKKLYQ